MNKNRKWLAALLSATLVVGFASCGDDDNDTPNPVTPPVDEPAGGSSVDDVDPSKVFPEGIPAVMGDMKITTNADGRVTEVTKGSRIAKFDYTGDTRSRADIPAGYDMTMSVTWTDDDDNMLFYFWLNDEGYVTSAYEIEYDGTVERDVETWSFEYNTAGQLKKMVRSEGGDEVTTITYTDGDITSVTVVDDEGDYDSVDIFYTTDAKPNKIENKGGVMMFDETLRIDMDEMCCAYVAGLLGKSTRNLPVYVEENDGYKRNYTWTLNAAGLPTNLVVDVRNSEGYGYTDTFKFAW